MVRRAAKEGFRMAATMSRELRDEVLAAARKKQDRVKAIATDLYMDRISRMARRGLLSEEGAARMRRRALRRIEDLMAL